MHDLDGFHLCDHHDTASKATLKAKGYERVETVVTVDDGPQTLVG